MVSFFCFLEMAEKNSASIEDILLLFIYLELGAVVGIFKTNHMPVRFLIYVAITALTRMLLEYLNNWHNSDSVIFTMIFYNMWRNSTIAISILVRIFII